MYRRKLLCFVGVTSNLHKKIHAALWPPTLLRDGEKCFPLLTSIIIKEKSTKSSNNGSSVVFLNSSRWSRGVGDGGGDGLVGDILESTG